MATTVDVSRQFLWKVPDSWSMCEAATVPVVYCTAYYALVIRGRIRKGDRVLIHSGSGGVGQAAISIALHAGCNVFTTVGSAEKRETLKRIFPALKDDHFGNSRDLSFESHFLRVTMGRGKNCTKSVWQEKCWYQKQETRQKSNKQIYTNGFAVNQVDVKFAACCVHNMEVFLVDVIL